LLYLQLNRDFCDTHCKIAIERHELPACDDAAFKDEVDWLVYCAIKHENLVFFRGKKLANREFRLAYTHAQARTNGVQWVRVVDNWCRRASAMCGFTFEFAEVDDACARRCGGAVV
jgi:hypothetical protein